MEHWHRLPRGCGVSSLEVSRSHLAVGLGTLLWVALGDLEGPACLSHAGILYIIQGEPKKPLATILSVLASQK